MLENASIGESRFATGRAINAVAAAALEVAIVGQRVTVAESGAVVVQVGLMGQETHAHG